MQRQGANDITVTVPGAGSQQVMNVVSTTAQLRIRPILLEGSVHGGAHHDAEPERDRHEERYAEGLTVPEVSTKAYIKHAAASPSPHGQGQRAPRQGQRDPAPRDQLGLVRGQHGR